MSPHANLHHTVHGEGVPVLLVHGIGRSLADWEEQVERLAPSCQMWSVDLPGFGGTPAPAAGMSLETLAAALADFVRAQGIQPVHVAGNSLGGAVAMQLAADHPELVRSLLLVDSAGFGRGVTLPLRLASIPGVGERAMTPSLEGARRSEAAMFHDPRFVTPQRVRQGYELAGRPGGTRAFLEILRSIGGPLGVKRRWRRALVPRVRATGIPVLIVWGDKDAVLPHRHLDRAAALLDARSHTFPDTGHGPQIERADEFAALALEFWTGVDDDAATSS